MNIPDDLWFKIRVHLSRVENILVDLLEPAPDSLTEADLANLCRIMHDSIDLNGRIE